MAEQKHIEVFPGSLSDLERMTGEQYEAVKDPEGQLVSVLDYSGSYYTLVKSLGLIAEREGYDAYVHVQNILDVVLVNTSYKLHGIQYRAYHVRKVKE